MAKVAAMYGLSEREAMNLTDAETNFLYEKAETTMISMAQSDKGVQAILRPALAPTLAAVKATSATAHK